MYVPPSRLSRYAGLAVGLGDDLRGRLAAEYRDGDSEFRRLWDGLQARGRCCGVDGPLDYNATWWQQGRRDELAAANTVRNNAPWSSYHARSLWCICSTYDVHGLQIARL